jgi:hypothetical protein
LRAKSGRVRVSLLFNGFPAQTRRGPTRLFAARPVFEAVSSQADNKAAEHKAADTAEASQSKAALPF